MKNNRRQKLPGAGPLVHPFLYTNALTINRSHSPNFVGAVRRRLWPPETLRPPSLARLLLVLRRRKNFASNLWYSGSSSNGERAKSQGQPRTDVRQHSMENDSKQQTLSASREMAPQIGAPVR